MIRSNHNTISILLQASQLEGKWCFQHNWKQTYLTATNTLDKPHTKMPLKVKGFYSDLLYQPWHCSTAPLLTSWLKRDTIDRRSGLSKEEFRQQYELPNKPVILQNAVSLQTKATGCKTMQTCADHNLHVDSEVYVDSELH